MVDYQDGQAALRSVSACHFAEPINTAQLTIDEQTPAEDAPVKGAVVHGRGRTL